MHLIRASLALAVVFLSQLGLPAAVADPQNTEPAEMLVHASEDPTCSKGFHAGFESNVWQLTVPASSFINKTGTFFHSEWYTGPLSATHGKDETIGATRTIVSGTDVFVERLVGIYRSPTQSVHRFSLTVKNPVAFGGATFTYYTEELRAMSICGGTATQFSMTSTYCADNIVAAYDEYDSYRRASVQKVVIELGARVFLGTCPVGNK
ncbi:hypothetical protein C0991_010784 [Blastosporella zonata]|nr:hypothetical protein C0991_010784 [Blastosporella zonata]